MMSTAFYAVKIGKIHGVYHSWQECKEMVDGFPNADFRKFASENAANKYVYGTDTTDIPNNITSKSSIIAYEFGDWNDNQQYASYCAIIVLDNKKITIKGRVLNNPSYITSKHLQGHVAAVEAILDYCKENKIPSVKIIYAYDGIKKFATREWHAKTALMQYYDNLMHDTDVRVSFQYNDDKSKISELVKQCKTA